MTAEARVTAVTVSITWTDPVPVTIGLGDVLLLPKFPAVPGLFRFHIGEASGTTWIHVGETSDLAKQMQQIARPGVPTSRAARLATRIRDTLVDDGMVTVATCVDVTADVDSQSATVDLVRIEDRRLAENAALVAARFDGADRLLTIGGE